MNRHNSTQLRLKPEASESTKAMLFDLAYGKDLELHGVHNGYTDIIWLREGAFSNDLISKIDEIEVIAKPPRVMRLATEEEVTEINQLEVISKDGKVIEKESGSLKDKYHFEDVEGNTWVEAETITKGCRTISSIDRVPSEEEEKMDPEPDQEIEGPEPAGEIKR